MSKRNTLLPLQTGEYYSNVLLIAPDGGRLATVGHDRAEWYLSRNLGTEIPTQAPYTRTIQLKFEPKGRPETDHGLHVKETRCVVCGTTESLTLHHVVPRMIRRSFPEKDAARQHLWCLLLCEKHHLDAEALYAPILTRSQEFKAIQKGLSHRPAPSRRLNALKIICHLTGNGEMSKLRESHPARIETLLSEAGLSELPSAEYAKVILDQNRPPTQASNGAEAVAEFAEQFIRENGGVERVKALFRSLFLKLEPKYMPQSSLMDIH